LAIDEVLANAATYKNQVSKILDVDKMQIAFNSEWFDKMSVLDVLKLTTHATVAQMLARSDFKKRLSKSENISLLEFMYPLLQGYDSVKLEADIELGGTDQVFNLLVGRDIQKDFGQAQQVVITMPLLEGTDGIQKMSKSYANFIAINENPNGMFGKIMSISDEMMLKYYTLLTDEDLEAVKKLHPKEAKLSLAENITRKYHGRELAEKARQEFEQVFSKRELPQDVPVYKLKKQRASIIDILLDSGLTESKNEARRLIQQGGVSFDGERLDKEDIIVDKEGILKVGKRRFLKLIKAK
jgi:tyrosyl-tRNA synthetase